MRKIEARPRLWRALLVFVAVAFTGAWAFSWLQNRLGIDIQLVALVQASPAIALLVTWTVLRHDLTAILPLKPAAPASFFRQLGIVAGASVAYAALTFVLAFAANALPTELPYSGWMLVLLLLLQFVGALGEEVGWRGFLQPAFANRFGVFVAAVIVGIIWASWHLDRLADPGMFFGFALTSIAVSFAMAAFTGGSWWQRGVLAALLHWTMNIVIYLFTNSQIAPESQPLAMMAFVLPPFVLGVAGLSVLLVRARSQHSENDSAGIISYCNNQQ